MYQNSCLMCGTPVPNTSKFCPKCGTLAPTPSAPLPPPQVIYPNPSTATKVSVKERYGKSATRRYRNSYRIARLVCLVGICVQIFGFIMGAGSAMIPLYFGNYSRVPISGILVYVAGFLVFVLIVLFWFLVGLVIRAHGEKLKIELDRAIYNSPFLTKENMAEAMSL
jgi:hypothetical protein